MCPPLKTEYDEVCSRVPSDAINETKAFCDGYRMMCPNLLARSLLGLEANNDDPV